MTTTCTPAGLLARFARWTAPQLPAERERVRAELAMLATRRGDPARAAYWRDQQRGHSGQERAA